MKQEIILFTGDSLVEQFDVINLFNYEGYQIVNRGVSGDTTLDMMKYLHSFIEMNPTIIFILIGTNDFTNISPNPDGIIERIKKIIEILGSKAPQTTIIVSSLLPVNEEMGRGLIEPRNNKAIDYINESLKTLKGVVYFDINPKLKDSNGELKEEYTQEGLHITELGYEKIIKELDQLFKKLIKTK